MLVFVLDPGAMAVVACYRAAALSIEHVEIPKIIKRSSKLQMTQ